MKPRITLSTTKDGTLEIFVNEAGRDLLVKRLLDLNKEYDHFHLGPDSIAAEVPLQRCAYRDGDQVFEWGKILFRPDEWDAQYFPHVLNAEPPPSP